MTDDASKADDFPEFTWLLVRVLPGDPPGAIKMRHALKAMLRSYGLRCERLLPATRDDEPPQTNEGKAN
ncbi:MAG TPA: hypothetical protein VHR66_33105 [Gemmataceae bacterium]|jgi:hypothetical protein|nr:hypothetical protein [Gemmataceae bacterium]